MPKQTPPNKDHKPWTSSELETLRKHGHLGAKRLAVMLQRSEAAVRYQASIQRISLRRKGERRGLVLGQRAGECWQGADRLGQIRRDVLGGQVSMEDLEQRVRDFLDPDLPVCPACAVRPQRRAATGLCEVCHLGFLARAHRETQAEADAQRELWKARQEASRARRRKARGEQVSLDELDEACDA